MVPHEPLRCDRRLVFTRNYHSRSIRWCGGLSRTVFLSSDHAIDMMHHGFAVIGKFPCKEELSVSVRARSSHFVHGLELQDMLHVDERRATLALTPVGVGDAPSDCSSER